MRLLTMNLAGLAVFAGCALASRGGRVRERDEDLSYCYGENSICEASNNLFDRCENYSNDNDLSQWYKCICANGYVSVDEACYWCQLEWNLPVFYNGPMDKDGCSSVGVPVAPIPSSVLELESIYNATYTGELRGGASAPVTTTDGGASSSSPSSAPHATFGGGATTKPTAHTTAASATTGKGTRSVPTPTTNVVTLDGGGAGVQDSSTASTSQTTSTSSTAGGVTKSGSGRVSGWDARTACAVSLCGFLVGLAVFGAAM